MKEGFLPESLKQIIISAAEEADQDMRFPKEAFDALQEKKLLQLTLPGNRLDQQKGNTSGLLNLMRETGATDLSVARIFEGHINALMLISNFAGEGHREKWFAKANEGSIFGIWNTQGDNGIRFSANGGDSLQISGAKTFCSGSAYINYPIITGELEGEGWQMAVVPGDQLKERVDASFWDPLGMKASVSHRIDFTGIKITGDCLIGKPGDYYQQPGFSGGAIRFCAAQLGGAQSILEETIHYLRSLGRTGDYAQKTRIAEMTVLLNSGISMLSRAAEIADGVKRGERDPITLVNFANMLRISTESIANQVMQYSEKSVGARGLMRPGRLERLHRDLRYYLRQPAPDATLIAVADHVLSLNTNTDDLWR